MIPFAEINRLVKKFQVPAETIEKDYVISWILQCLSASKLKKDFIFYGGTSIKRIYFEDHRFSEDIDLTTPKKFKEDYLTSEITRLLIKAAEQANLSMRVNPSKVFSSGTRIQIFVEYSGYEEITGPPKEIQIDFAMGMELYGKTCNRRLDLSYSDLRSEKNTLRVMTLNTILAGKLGLLMESTRKEPRDLFDIWFLLERIDQFDFNLKLLKGAFKQKYGFNPSASLLTPHLKNRLYRDRWELRLAKQIAKIPPVDKVIDDVEHNLKNLFK